METEWQTLNRQQKTIQWEDGYRGAATTAKPAPEPTGTATNVTLRVTGDESYLQRGYLYYLKVSNEFINNSDVLEYT